MAVLVLSQGGRELTSQDGNGLEVLGSALLEGNGDGASIASSPFDGHRLADLDIARERGKLDDLGLCDNGGDKSGSCEESGEEHFDGRIKR